MSLISSRSNTAELHTSSAHSTNAFYKRKPTELKWKAVNMYTFQMQLPGFFFSFYEHDNNKNEKRFCRLDLNLVRSNYFSLYYCQPGSTALHCTASKWLRCKEKCPLAIFQRLLFHARWAVCSRDRPPSCVFFMKWDHHLIWLFTYLSKLRKTLVINLKFSISNLLP